MCPVFDIPLVKPMPPRLSEMAEALREIEHSGTFSNGGPVVRRFEEDATGQLFGGQGDCLAVANATVGLMIALKQVEVAGGRIGGMVVMPALTFPATALAAQWAGLTPLICDVDPGDWSACARAEQELLERHGDRITALMPYATFGAAIDLDRYRRLAEAYGVGVVVDAAASLGTLDGEGHNFGAGAPFAVVYSMHATKTFATAEGGLIHSADTALIATLRRMSNFGFGAERSPEIQGMNAKLPEVLGLLARAKLDGIDAVCAHRAALAGAYRERLAGLCTPQRQTAPRQAMQFWPMLLPEPVAARRGQIIADLAARGIQAGHYFSPHLGEQTYFSANAIVEPTPVADGIAARMLSLPLHDAMSLADVAQVCEALRAAILRAHADQAADIARAAKIPTATVLIGGGPAGTALLTAAAKQDRLVALARRGLTVVERGGVLGTGMLGTYAIRSDTTAETFLSAVKDNCHPEIAAVADQPAGRRMARSIGALGAPLADAGPLLAATGQRLREIVEGAGGTVLTHHDAQFAQRTRDGLWRTTLRDAQGFARELLSERIVLATGGFQSPESVAGARVGHQTLDEMAGDRLMLSDDFLKTGGLDAARDYLDGARAPRIAIVGGSTSAMAAAVLLLKANPALPLGAGAITLLHRHPLRPFYPSREAAHADGFHDFTEDDICPVSGFVYRLAGFRLESRELVLRMLGIGGREPDPRLALHAISHDNDDAAARAIISEADLVIGATGYRPHAFNLLAADGTPIRLACRAEEQGPLVDDQCRVIDATHQPVPGAYGIGFAAGIRTTGALGGEPSFTGQSNGLWLWQNAIGQRIVDQLLATAQTARPPLRIVA